MKKTDEEIRAEAERVTERSYNGLFIKNGFCKGAKWYRDSCQSSMEAEIERRANEKVEEYKRELKEVLNQKIKDSQYYAEEMGEQYDKGVIDACEFIVELITPKEK